MGDTHEPEFIVCAECETPCYTFEWDHQHERIAVALCSVCGNEESEEFQTEEKLYGDD